jgi:hypothetical protein
MTNETTTAPMAPSEEAQRAIPPEVMEKVIIGGDLSELNAAQRAEYYTAVCRSLELHPPTKPFEFLTLNGKLRLYALRDCTDQLRRLHGISIYITNRERMGDIYIVTARAKDRTRREDESTGAVALGNLKGDALCSSYKALRFYCLVAARCPSISSMSKAFTVVWRSSAACFKACFNRSGICTVIVVIGSSPAIKWSMACSIAPVDEASRLGCPVISNFFPFIDPPVILRRVLASPQRLYCGDRTHPHSLGNRALTRASVRAASVPGAWLNRRQAHGSYAVVWGLRGSSHDA